MSANENVTCNVQCEVKGFLGQLKYLDSFYVVSKKKKLKDKIMNSSTVVKQYGMYLSLPYIFTGAKDLFPDQKDLEEKRLVQISN